MNSTSHWLHGDRAALVPHVDLEHTLVGYATHHAASILWAYLFEHLRERGMDERVTGVARDAVLTAVIAAIVDYTITPRRLTPGWELVLSKRSMALGYVGMAAGLVAAELLTERHRPLKPGH